MDKKIDIFGEVLRKVLSNELSWVEAHGQLSQEETERLLHDLTLEGEGEGDTSPICLAVIPTDEWGRPTPSGEALLQRRIEEEATRWEAFIFPLAPLVPEQVRLEHSLLQRPVIGTLFRGRAPEWEVERLPSPDW